MLSENIAISWKDESGTECEYIKQELPVVMTYTRTLKGTNLSALPDNQGQQNQNKVSLPPGTKIMDTAGLGKYIVTGKGTVAYAGAGNTSAKSNTIPKQIVYLNVAYKSDCNKCKRIKRQ